MDDKYLLNFIEKQQNILSDNLLKVYRKNLYFAIVILPIIACILSLILYICVVYPTNPGNGIWVLTSPFYVALLGWIGWTLGKRNVAKEIHYTHEGIFVVKYSGSKIFIYWNEIQNLRPLIQYGKIKVPDYILSYKKPFPGFTPVSAEVAEKIMEYMKKYKQNI